MEPSCPLGTTRLVPQEKFPKSHIINTLLTKLVWSRRLDIGLVLFFCVFMDLDSVSVHKHAKKELGQYPAILNSHLVNNPYILTKCNYIIDKFPTFKVVGLEEGYSLSVCKSCQYANLTEQPFVCLNLISSFQVILFK